MEKQNLIEEITKWRNDHPLNSVTSNVYWTMRDLLHILHNNPSKEAIDACRNMFDRFKWSY